jgi:hypothetical protein
MRFFRSAVVGVFLAIAGFVLAFALAPFFDVVVRVYLAPAGLLLPVVGPLISSKAVYWLVADGGATAGVLMVGVCALFFWTIVFGVAHFAWVSLRREGTDSSPVSRRR